MICFDRVADIYDATRGLPAQAERSVGDGLARIYGQAGPSPRVLEIGVGTGRMAVPLTARGVRVVGIDMSRAMLAVLRAKRPQVPAALALADALPFAPGSFDGALFVHLLHLVPDARAVLRAAFRVVRPGGIVVLGGDDAPTGLMRDVSEALRSASQAAGIDFGLWNRYRMGLEAGEAGLQEMGAECSSERLAGWPSPISARQILERMQKRVNSQTWDLAEETLASLIESATPPLEHLCGGLDRVHEAERGFAVLIGRLPPHGAGQMTP